MLLAVALSLCTAGVAHAFSLGTAANYGILTEAGAPHTVQMANSTLNGNWGIGTGGTAQFANGTVNGNVDFQGTSNPPGGTITGSVNGNVAAVGTALATVNSLATTLGSESGNSLAITGNGQTINATSGHLDGSGNYVFNVTSLSLSGGITVKGNASQYVVFDFNNGNGNVKLNGTVSLTGGITADHVLFNFTGTGGQLGGNTHGGIINGDFLFPNMTLVINNTTIDGRLFGGQPGQDFKFLAHTTLNAPIPEPGTAVLMLGGLGLMGLVSRRRR
jgi:hypothetical protein